MPVFFDNSLSWNYDRIAREQARLESDVRECIEATVSASAFDTNTPGWLADRERYPVAVNMLHLLTRKPHDRGTLISILNEHHVSPEILIRRLCVYHTIIRSYINQPAPSVDELATMAADDANARLVLALVGKCDWAGADRRTRAAFLLGALVRKSTGRDSP